MVKNKGFSKLPKDVQKKMMKKMAEGGAVKKTGMRGGGMVKKTGMKKGGMVKKTRMRKKSIDGIARKGKTRGTNR